MSTKRVHNFSAGPAILPLEVLQQAQNELLDFANTGSSVMEISHRGKPYLAVHDQAIERLRRLTGVDESWHVLFLQGGASTQFAMVPMNFLPSDGVATYLNTGEWSRKAIKEAKRFGSVHVPFSSEASNFNRVPTPDEYEVDPASSYLHFTSNNTIFGTEFPSEPISNGVPLVCDASSDFLSRPLDMERYGLIYAGAQKNLGPSGLAIVMIKDEFLKTQSNRDIPTILNYNTHVETMFNTPPTFTVYMVNLVLGWLENQGGLTGIQKFNEEKASKLYAEIDRDDFYTGTAEIASRSLMNVTFRLGSEELEERFVKEATAAGLDALKGHRSVGGIRASIYNACPMESVDALISFMQEFRKQS
jgi:phosphoserine aminotransferase